jgi:hypothetical protein
VTNAAQPATTSKTTVGVNARIKLAQARVPSAVANCFRFKEITMRLKTVSVTYGRKLNLGDFNSVHAEISLWADLEEGDDEAAAAEALRSMARNQVMLELARVEQRLQAKVEGVFAGLPLSVQKQLNGANHD